MKTFKVTIISKGASYTFADIWKIVRTDSGYRLSGDSEGQSFGIYYHASDVDYIKIEIGRLVMTKNISITLPEDLIKYIDELCESNGRTRSGMIAWLIKKSYDEDVALDEEARSYGYHKTISGDYHSCY